MATKSERGRKAGRSGQPGDAPSEVVESVVATGRAREAAGDDVRLRRREGGTLTAAQILAHTRFAVTMLFVALAFGIVLETLHAFKAVAYLMDPVRREFWSLAHFHGVGLGLVNLVYISWAERSSVGGTGLWNSTRSASTSLMAGSVLLPLGFLLGGIGHYGSDPGLGIFLAPVGAALILYAIGVNALALWKR